MGTKVQCDNYLPGYYYMVDLNDDVRGEVCSHFYEDAAMIGGKFYNGSMQQNFNCYSESEKELLKHTMLHHEAVFRKQVTELHRLYQVQRDLMDAVKKKETIQYSLPTESMHESKCPFDNSVRTWQIQMPSAVSSTCSRQSGGSDTENMQSSFTLLKDNGSMHKYCEPHDLERNPSSKRTFDLQLPADEYIDIEDIETPFEEVKVLHASSRSLFGDKYGFNKSSNILAESEVKLTLSIECKTNVRGNRCEQQTDPLKNDLGYKISESRIDCQGQPNQTTTASFKVPGEFVDEIKTRQLPFQLSASSSQHWKYHIDECNSGNGQRQSWNRLDSECNRSRVYCHSSNLASGRLPEGNCGKSKLEFGQYTSDGLPSYLQHKNVHGQFDLEKPCALAAFHLSNEQKQKDLLFKDHADSHIGLPKMNLPDLNQVNAVTPTSLPGAFSTPTHLEMANTSCAKIPWRTLMNTTPRLPFGIQSQEGPQEKDHPNKAALFSPLQVTGLSQEKRYCNDSLRRCSQRVDCDAPYHNGFALSERPANGSYPPPSLYYLDLNSIDYSSCTYSKDSCSEKLLKAVNHHDIQTKGGVSSTLAFPNNVRDGSEVQSHNNLFFSKEQMQGNRFEDEYEREATVKSNSKSAHSINSRGGCLSRLLHQSKSSIDLEAPIEVESEMPMLCEKRAVDAGSITQSNGGAGSVHDRLFLPDSKHKLSFSPQEWKPHDSSSSKLSFLREPISIDFWSGSVSINGCQRFGGSKNHAHIGESHGSTHCITLQGFAKQISIDEVHDSHINKVIHENSIGLCHRDSITSSQMKHKPINKGASSQGRACTVEGKTAKSTDEERSGGRGFDLNLDISHQMAFGLHCDSVVMQTPLPPTRLLEIFRSTEESTKTDGLMATGILFGMGDNSIQSSATLDNLAAEMLIRISSLGSEISCSLASNQPELPSCESLKWFADVCCDAEHTTDSSNIFPKADNEDQQEPSEEDDFFESMTLMLEDTKMDEDYCFKPKPLLEETMDHDIDTSTPQKQPTRRTPRRGMRQKDFQRDILPSLMSLCRTEINEDMQTFGSLMRASGCFWQTGLARRNGTRNEKNSQKRGRRLRYSTAAMEVDDEVLGILHATCDPEVDKAMEMQAFSWGTITRRRRKQRCPGTVPPSCSTKKT